MSQTEHFVVNSERVVHETIDGETIIIQLETGTYYSLAGSGADIWAMLAEGRSSDEIVSELERRYDESAEELDQATAELVSELRREELLEDLPASALPARSQNGTESNASNTARMSFERPTLQKYTDMQYFLLLDPIHEVDKVGWPSLSDQPSP